MEPSSNGEEDFTSLDEPYKINLIPSELFLKFREEIEGIRIGVILEERHIQVLQWQVKISSSSIKDLAKPENPFNRKCKNELSRSKIWDENHNYPLKSKDKRPSVTLRSIRSKTTNIFVLQQI